MRAYALISRICTAPCIGFIIAHLAIIAIPTHPPYQTRGKHQTSAGGYGPCACCKRPPPQSFGGRLQQTQGPTRGLSAEKAQIDRRPLHAGFAPSNAPLRSNSARDALPSVGGPVLGFRSATRSSVLHQHSASICCGHFIKSPRIVYRLAHRHSAVRLEADTRGARGPLASPALPLVNWGAGIAPLSPLLRAGLWRCLRRLRAFICSLAVMAVPLSSVS